MIDYIKIDSREKRRRKAMMDVGFGEQERMWAKGCLVDV